MAKISHILKHDFHRGCLLLCGHPVICRSDLAHLPMSEQRALVSYFGVSFDAMCDAFELTIN